MAEPFLQVAAQAPQPTHAAASIDSSASAFGIGMALPSGTELVRTEMKPPACRIWSYDERFTTRSLMTGNAAERQGSMVMVAPSGTPCSTTLSAVAATACGSVVGAAVAAGAGVWACCAVGSAAGVSAVLPPVGASAAGKAVSPVVSSGTISSTKPSFWGIFSRPSMK